MANAIAAVVSPYFSLLRLKISKANIQVSIEWSSIVFIQFYFPLAKKKFS